MMIYLKLRASFFFRSGRRIVIGSSRKLDFAQNFGYNSFLVISVKNCFL